MGESGEASALFRTRTSPPPSTDPIPTPSSPPPPTPPFLAQRRRRRILDGQAEGVLILDSGTEGRLEGCDIWGNKEAGVHVQEGADPTLLECE